MRICRVDEQKATWFQSDFCVSCVSCIATLFDNGPFAQKMSVMWPHVYCEALRMEVNSHCVQCVHMILV